MMIIMIVIVILKLRGESDRLSKFRFPLLLVHPEQNRRCETKWGCFAPTCLRTPAGTARTDWVCRVTLVV